MPMPLRPAGLFPETCGQPPSPGGGSAGAPVEFFRAGNACRPTMRCNPQGQSKHLPRLGMLGVPFYIHDNLRFAVDDLTSRRVTACAIENSSAQTRLVGGTKGPFTIGKITMAREGFRVCCGHNFPARTRSKRTSRQ